uniref:Chemosensory protein 16 n=2 Tax=Adelphocoris TaxID=236345 RepID=A0A346RVI2_ADELI|nr:chemosensory protein 1 [Adelphocoris suturalis]AXS78222.1 chemosensory protein 16 [Adelphocoris lineolatus]
MLPFYVFSLCAVFVACQETYTSKYDNVNVEDALKNDRLYKAYFNCLADRGPCTREGNMLKEALPDGLRNNCSLCTDPQRRGTHQVIRFLFKYRPEDMKLLEEIYDPEGIYKTKYAEERKKLME